MGAGEVVTKENILVVDLLYTLMDIAEDGGGAVFDTQTKKKR